MARVTAIRTAEQRAYRLQGQCAERVGRDRAQRDYRLHTAAGGRPVERAGSGWRAVGRRPGQPLAAEEHAEMHAVMQGTHPDTGTPLLTRKTRVPDEARLPAGPLLAALDRAGVDLAAETWAGRRVARMRRGVARARRAPHTVAVRDLERVARAAGVPLDKVFAAEDLERARARAHVRVDAGPQGWDLRLDVRKEISAIWALAGPELAARLEEAVMQAARDTVAEAERRVARGQRGWHGDGHVARRVGTAGLIATLTLHHTARPVGGHPDPHLHVHAMIAAISQGEDGRWCAIGRGGRELYEAVPDLGAYMRERVRHHTRQLGVRWHQTPQGDWEVEVPQALRDLFSRRRDQALRRAGEGASAEQRRSAARRTAAPKGPGTPAEWRVIWAERARGAGHDPATVVRAATISLTLAQARAGHGPAATAAAPQLRDLHARQQLARARADAARRRVADLEPLAASRIAAWRAGTTRHAARADLDRAAGDLQAAIVDAADFARAARDLRARAIAEDIAVARAQARAAVARAQERAVAAALTQTARPPTPGRPRTSPTPRPGPWQPGHHRPRGPSLT